MSRRPSRPAQTPSGASTTGTPERRLSTQTIGPSTPRPPAERRLSSASMSSSVSSSPAAGQQRRTSLTGRPPALKRQDVTGANLRLCDKACASFVSPTCNTSAKPLAYAKGNEQPPSPPTTSSYKDALEALPIVQKGDNIPYRANRYILDQLSPSPDGKTLLKSSISDSTITINADIGLVRAACETDWKYCITRHGSLKKLPLITKESARHELPVDADEGLDANTYLTDADDGIRPARLAQLRLTKRSPDLAAWPVCHGNIVSSKHASATPIV